MAEFHTVASLSDVAEGTLHAAEANGVRLVLANSGGTIYALEDCCSHEEFALSEGELTGDQVTCVLHGARFDLATGAPRALPAVKPVRRFDCRVQGDKIQVRLD